ncbi:Sphingosine kinase 1 [Dispira simplex]|nr:Sphingosine kinase 1 [Dispira simplex]
MTSSSSSQFARRVLILVNPNAGVYRAASVQEWSHRLAAFWARHTITQPKVIITQSYTQVQQTLREFLITNNSNTSHNAPNTQYIIICFGGDGTVHGVVNALYDILNTNSSTLSTVGPSDTTRSTHYLVGVVPVGSGNALATALHLGTAEQAMLRYADPQITNEPVCRPLRTMQVTLPPGATLRSDAPPSDVTSGSLQQNSVQSFCVVSWGFHCNNVSSSEWLRFLGPLRFLLAGLKNLALLRDYYGQITLGCAKRFQPSDQTDSSLQGEFVPLTPETDLNPVTLEGPFTVFLAAKQAVLSDNFCITPFAKPDDAFIDVIIGRGLTRGQTMAIFQGAASQGRHVLLPFVEYYKVQCLAITPRNSPEDQVDPNALHEFCIDGEIVQVKEPGHVKVEVDTAEHTLLQTIS